MHDNGQSVSWGALGSLAGWSLAFFCLWFVGGPLFESYVRHHPGWDIGVVVLFYSVVSVVLSAAVYQLRRLLRTFYGLIELGVMFFLSAIGYIEIIRNGGDTSALPPTLVWLEGLKPSVTFAAAIYLGVRALDNIGEGLGPDSFWDAVFPKE
jgi:hypothetical protein